MNKDKLPVVALALGGFALFIALISGSVWYMSNWASQEARTTLTSPISGPVVAVRPAPQGPVPRPGDEFGVGRPEGIRPAEPDGLPRPGTPPDAGLLPDPEGRLPDGRRPRVAIVIDDWGYEWAAAEAFLAFPEQLTVAVLPFLPNSQSHATQALTAGHQVILHMPMEAQNTAIDIGPGGVRTSMNDDEIAVRVAAALAHIPGVSGMNNHMGSLATGDPRVMRAALEVVRKQGLFFLDSFTAATTVGPEVARLMAVPHAVNQVFLDHVDTEEHVRGQIARLVRLAQERGHAVGIGHVRPNTYNALIGMLPELQAAGIEFVTVSELLTQPTPDEIAVASAKAAEVGAMTESGAAIAATAAAATTASGTVAETATATASQAGAEAAGANVTGIATETRAAGANVTSTEAQAVPKTTDANVTSREEKGATPAPRESRIAVNSTDGSDTVTPDEPLFSEEGEPPATQAGDTEGLPTTGAEDAETNSTRDTDEHASGEGTYVENADTNSLPEGAF